MNDTDSESHFEISQFGSDSSVVLNVRGELDVKTAPQLKRAMDSCFVEGVGQLEIALDMVPKIDSSGIATLVEGLRWSRRTNNSFFLSGLQAPVLDLVRLSNLENEFDIRAGEKASQ